MSTSYDVFMKKVCPQKKRNLNILQIFCKSANKTFHKKGSLPRPAVKAADDRPAAVCPWRCRRDLAQPPFPQAHRPVATLPRKGSRFEKTPHRFLWNNSVYKTHVFLFGSAIPTAALWLGAEKARRPKIGHRTTPVLFGTKRNIRHRSVRKRSRATSKAPGSKISSRDARAAFGSGIPSSTHSSTKPVRAWV